MEELSFLDKLKILFDNFLAHPLFTLMIFVPVIVYFLQKKHGKKIFIIVYFLIIFSILMVFGDLIFKLFDNLMDGIFMVLYFPNFITLFTVVLLTSVFTLITIFSAKMHRINKIINYVSFGIIHILFVIILVTIKINKINVYKDSALYTNKNVLSMMQLLVGMFMLQMISILIIFLVDKVTEKLDKHVSNDVATQVTKLKKNKTIKIHKIDNDKVGFINVADIKATSKPKLKPFKFDVRKIESINLNVYEKPKLYNVITLNNNLFRYLNEQIKLKKFKLVSLNAYKQQNVKLNNEQDDNLFQKMFGENKMLDSQNREAQPPKIKPIYLDLNKTQNIKLNGRTNEKTYNKVNILDKGFSYLNEIIKPKKYKKLKLDTNKINYIQLNGKTKDKKPFKNIDLNLNKTYIINIKPDLMKPMTFNKRFISRKILVIENPMVKNFSILDMQSTIDAVSKCHLMKDGKLKGFDNVLTITNLKINNFDLLLKTIKKYKLYK